MKNYKIDWRKNHFVVSFKGNIYLNDSLNVKDDFVSDERFDSISFFLSDLRSVNQIDYSNNDFKIHATYSKAVSMWAHGRKLRVALIVSNSEHEQIVREFISVTENFGGNWIRKVFKNIDEAYSWASLGEIESQPGSGEEF